MITTKRYFEEIAGDGLASVWAVTSGEGEAVTIVATGSHATTGSVDLDNPLTDVPDGWREIEEETYTTEIKAHRQAEIDAQNSQNEEADERRSVLDRIVDAADDIIGGIL